MKVNLLFNNPSDFKNGFLNIDPAADGTDGRVPGDLGSLNAYVQGGEATELVAHDILCLFPPEAVAPVLDNWVSKLAHGGTITVSCPDIREIARVLLAGNLPAEQAENLIYRGRQSVFTVSRLVDLLQSRGLKIMLKKVNTFRGIVVGTRP